VDQQLLLAMEVLVVAVMEWLQARQVVAIHLQLLQAKEILAVLEVVLLQLLVVVAVEQLELELLEQDHQEEQAEAVGQEQQALFLALA
jgi:hypothetical protein